MEVFFISCNFPLKAFYRIREDGKKDIKFAEYKDQDVLFADGLLYTNKIDIPCGQCTACRLEYSRQWATRCMLEAQQYEHNYFITLTYNDENKPFKLHDFFDDNGEYLESSYVSSLLPKDLTKFIKDLRRYFKYHFGHSGIRFFACGEYGPKNLRPHFHIILFNCPIPDLVFLQSNFNGDSYYSSKILEHIWHKGFVCIGDCNFNTCSYVARYMMKKQKGLNADFYNKHGIIPPFVRSSRMPGLARFFYDSQRDKIYNYDSLVIVGKDGKAKKVHPPKYFDRLYDIECPDDLQRIKSQRSKSAKNSKRQQLELLEVDYDTYLATKEDILLSKTNKLIRPI